MLSTINKDMKFVDGVMNIVPKEYPNWYGIEGIGFIWHNSWADPEIEYDGEVLNSHIVEDTMWERYNEDCKEQGIEPDEEEGFSNYMRDNRDEVIELIELALGRVEW